MQRERYRETRARLRRYLRAIRSLPTVPLALGALCFAANLAALAYTTLYVPVSPWWLHAFALVALMWALWRGARRPYERLRRRDWRESKSYSVGDGLARPSREPGKGFVAGQVVDTLGQKSVLVKWEDTGKCTVVAQPWTEATPPWQKTETETKTQENENPYAL